MTNVVAWAKHTYSLPPDQAAFRSFTTVLTYDVVDRYIHSLLIIHGIIPTTKIRIILFGKQKKVNHTVSGYRSLFHTVLSSEQENYVRKHGDLSDADKQSGFRLTTNKQMLNRIEPTTGRCLLTWEVAKLRGGLLHTYDMAKNLRYKSEVDYIGAFLDYFNAIGDSSGEKRDDDEEHKYIAELKMSMFKKMSESDAEVMKVKAQKASNGLRGAIQLAAEKQKAKKLSEQLKIQRRKGVEHDFWSIIQVKRHKK